MIVHSDSSSKEDPSPNASLDVDDQINRENASSSEDNREILTDNDTAITPSENHGIPKVDDDSHLPVIDIDNSIASGLKETLDGPVDVQENISSSKETVTTSIEGTLNGLQNEIKPQTNELHSVSSNKVESLSQEDVKSDSANKLKAMSVQSTSNYYLSDQATEVIQDFVPCNQFQPNAVHQNENFNNEKPSSSSENSARSSVCRDPLNILAQSYEDTEPLYLSGIVDHITKKDNCEVQNETLNANNNENNTTINSDSSEGFSVTDLMSNESMSDIFDKVYTPNTNDQHYSRIDDAKIFHFPSINCDTESNESIDNSSCGSSDLEDRPKIDNVAIKSSLRKRNKNEDNYQESPCKKPRRGITFDSVSVYYFPRMQGFTCIPSQGGSTLGMSWNHSHIRKFSLREHAAEQRRAHRQYCLQQFSDAKNWNEMSNMSSDDSDSEEMMSDSEVDCENYNFLQPIPTRKRRALLRAAGIHKIDSGEKDECRSIRLSREFCGCTCQIYCDPDRCVCAQAGIKCQVDRMNFPCSCTRDGCANENGRIEFNPVRVRTHYIHTLMRLEMEKKKEEEEQQDSLLMNNMENSTHLAYSSSLSQSSQLNSNTNLMNFSYHTHLQSYYQPHQGNGDYVDSVANSAACFNFNTYGVASEQFDLGSTVDSQYNQSLSRLTVANAASSTSMQFCNQLSFEQADECPRLFNYNSANLPIMEMNENFVLRDLTNSSKSNDSDSTYEGDSLMQLNIENFEPQMEGAIQGEILDTSAEVSEETEKEESDGENFGDIIKKTMVESVIA